MKIVLVTPNYPVEKNTIRGGVEGACYYLSQGMKKIKGIEIEVIVPFSEKDQERMVKVDGINVHRMAGKNTLRKYLVFFFKCFRKELEDKIRLLKPDLVHVQSTATFCKNLDIPSVFTLHGFRELDTQYSNSYFAGKLKSLFLFITERQARKNIKNVVAISPYAHKYLRKEQIIIDLGNPIADSFFQIKGKSKKNRIFTASRFDRVKNIEGLIRSFYSVLKAKPELELRIAGGDLKNEYGKKCVKLVKELHLTNKIKFLGLLNIEQLQDELRNSTIFTLVSFLEHAPISISEAMAAGLPILASNVGGIPWMVSEGVNGRLVDPHSIESIQKGFYKLLFTDDLKLMGNNSRKEAEKKFKVDVIARRTVEFYKEVLQKE